MYSLSLRGNNQSSEPTNQPASKLASTKRLSPDEIYGLLGDGAWISFGFEIGMSPSANAGAAAASLTNIAEIVVKAMSVRWYAFHRNPIGISPQEKSAAIFIQTQTSINIAENRYKTLSECKCVYFRAVTHFNADLSTSEQIKKNIVGKKAPLAIIKNFNVDNFANFIMLFSGRPNKRSGKKEQGTKSTQHCDEPF